MRPKTHGTPVSENFRRSVLLTRGWQHLDEPIRIPAWRKLALVLRHGLTGR